MTMWARAIKTSLGDVWHAVSNDAGHARCDKRIRVDTDTKKEPPKDSYACKRCLAIMSGQRVYS